MIRAQKNIIIFLVTQSIMSNATCIALRLTDTGAVKETQLCTGQYEECLPSTTVLKDNIDNLISVESAKYAESLPMEQITEAQVTEDLSEDNIAATNKSIPDPVVSESITEQSGVEEVSSPETVYVPQVVYVEADTTEADTITPIVEESEIENIPSEYQSEDLGIFGWNQSEDLLIGGVLLEENLLLNDYGGGNLYNQLLTNETNREKEIPTGTDWSLFYWGLIGIAAYVYTLFVVKSMLCPYYKAKVEMDRKKSGSR